MRVLLFLKKIIAKTKFKRQNGKNFIKKRVTKGIENDRLLMGNIFIVKIVWYEKSLPKINKKNPKNIRNKITKYFIKLKNNLLSIINKNKKLKTIKKMAVNLVKIIKLRRKLVINNFFYYFFNGKKKNKNKTRKKRKNVSPVKVGHQ